MAKFLWKIVVALVVIAGLASGYMAYKIHWMGVVSTGEKIQAASEKKPLLLVIDIQEGTTGSLALSKGLKEQSGPFIEKVNSVIDAAKTQKMPIVYIKQINTDFLMNLLSGWRFLAEGTPSVEIDKRVLVVSQNIFPKQKMDAFSNPDFDAFLRQQGINTLYVTGLDAAACVDRTIKGALNRGYQVIAIQDAIISSSIQKRDEKFADYTKEGVTFALSNTWMTPAN